jgi:hypothetical protein
MNALCPSPFQTVYSALCSVDFGSKRLRRWEVGGAKPRLTHVADFTGSENLLVELVPIFMSEPGDEFAVQSPPFPRNEAHGAA